MGWFVNILASALLRIPPLKFCSLALQLPPFLAQSLLRSLPHSRRPCPCLVPSLPRSFPSLTLPPSTLPSSTDALCLPIIIASSLPPSLPPLALSLPPPLAPSLPPSILPPPSLAPSHPPSFLAPCRPPSLHAYLPLSN